MDNNIFNAAIDDETIQFCFKEGKLDKVKKIKDEVLIKSFYRSSGKYFWDNVSSYLFEILKNQPELFKKIFEYKEDSELRYCCVVVFECNYNNFSSELIEKIHDSQRKLDMLYEISKEVYIS